MRAEELRIGNWVMVGEQKSIVDSISIGNKNNDRNIHVQGNGVYNREDQVKPIPLTEEILEKCGFERRIYDNNKKNPVIVEHLPELAAMDLFEHRKYITKDGWQIVIEETDEWDIWYGKEESWEGSLPLCSIKYLHQLQNLYYVLTGTELKINL